MSLFDSTISFLSRAYRSFSTRSKTFNRAINYLAHISLPIGLSYPYGKLYGWTIHDKLHNPEQETVDFFKKHLKKGDRIADVGANIGYYTLLFSHLVGDEGKVMAFEPSPSALTRLKKAVRGLNNVTIVEKGIYSHRDKLRLYSLKKADPMGSVTYQRGPHFSEISVVPFSDYSAEGFTWAKIDVEGAELEVLKGISIPIKATLEVAQGIQEKYNGGVKNFLEDIQSMGYDVSFIRDGGNTVPYIGSNLDLLESNIFIQPRA